MATALHSKQVAPYIHTSVAYVYADAAARTGATGFTSEDLYKFAWQLDSSSLWVLTSVTPTWSQIAVGSATDVASVLKFGNRYVGSTTTTRYLGPGVETLLATVDPVQIPVPRIGTFRRLYVQHNTPAGNGNAIVYTLRVNGVASSLSVSMASTSSQGSDLVNSAASASGDLIDIAITKAADVGTSPQNVVACVEFE